jgi:hypothetical protein
MTASTERPLTTSWGWMAGIATLFLLRREKFSTAALTSSSAF